MPCEVPLNLAGHVGYFGSIRSAKAPISIPCLNLKGTETNEKNKTAACDLRSYCADAAFCPAVRILGESQAIPTPQLQCPTTARMPLQPML